MRNYGFDYLVEKVQVLNEMARFSPFWRNEFPEFENLYLQVQGIMKKHPKAPPSPTLGHRRLEYVTKSLFNFLSADDLKKIGVSKNVGFDQSVQDLAIRQLAPEERIDRKTRAYTPEYAKFAPKNADNTQLQQEFMLRLMVKSFPEIALSPQFTKKLLNQNNIYDYADKHFDKRGSSKFAYGTVNRKEELLGMDLENFYEIQNKAKGIIQRLRKSKNIPKGLLMSIYHSERSLEKQDTQLKKDDLFDLKVFKTTIEDLMEYRRDLVKNMSQMDFLSDEQNRLTDVDKSVFESMLNSINISIQKGQPIPKEQIEKIVPRVMGKVSDVVLKNYNQNYEFESTDDDAELKADRYQTIYDSLDDDLLNHMIKQGNITPEEKEILKAWRNGASNLQQTIVSKNSRDTDKAEEAQYKKDAATLRKYNYEKKGKEMEAKKGQKQPKKTLDDLSSNPAELKAKLEELMASDDPDFEEIDRIGKKLKKLGGLNESSVMSYMTEQVNKDGFSDNRGKFVDRGFKKPKNYAHWLWLNNQ